MFVDDYKSSPVFGDTDAPIIQVLEVDSGKITSGIESDGEPTIKLNATLFYYIFMLDPMATFFSDSPQILPQTMLSLKANHMFVFIKVVLSNSEQLFMETDIDLSLIFTYLRP